MIDRMVAGGMLPRGSAIGFISSAAGLGWEANLEVLNEYLDIADFDEAAAWAQDHGKADYMWSKQAICAYVAREAFAFLQAGHPHQRDPARARPTRRSRRRTRRCGSASAPTTAKRSASRPRRRSSRRTRSCSCAATRLRASPASRWSPTPATSAAGVTESFPAAKEAVGFLSLDLSAPAARPLPQLTPFNEWFWTSGADGTLRIQRCDDCRDAGAPARADLPGVPQPHRVPARGVGPRHGRSGSPSTATSGTRRSSRRT